MKRSGYERDSFGNGGIVKDALIPPMLCYLLLKSTKGLASRPIDSASLVTYSVALFERRYQFLTDISPRSSWPMRGVLTRHRANLG